MGAAVVDAQRGDLPVTLDENRVPLVVVDARVHVQRLSIVAEIEEQPRFALDQFQVEEIELAAIVDVGERAVVSVRSNVKANVAGEARAPRVERHVGIGPGGEHERRR